MHEALNDVGLDGPGTDTLCFVSIRYSRVKIFDT